MTQKTYHATTVGELRAVLADLPDDLPVYRRGDMGDCVVGMTLTTAKLSRYSTDTSYVADRESDAVWRQSKYDDSFLSPFAALVAR